MGINFKVAMVLEAVNRMDGGIRGAMNSANRLKRSFADVAKETSRLNPVSGWTDKINRVAEAAKRLEKNIKTSGKSLSETGEKMQHQGFRNVAEGTGLLAPIIDMANKAGQLQMKMTSMQMSGISKRGTDELMERADKYTERTLFSKTEIADMYLSMRQSGMKEQNILRGSEPMVMLAELENIRRGTMGTETAKVLAQMAERGGILQDPNIERWNKFLELVNKVTTVTTAGIPELHESSKYLEPSARIANWSEKDMMWSQGIAARFGLEGSVAGTDLKNMVERINPYKWYKEGRPDFHLDAMDRLGWLSGVESHKGKTGRISYDGIGGSVMLKEDGSTANLMDVFGHFAKSWERYKTLPQGRAKFATDMSKVLGAEGEKVANLVSQNYEVITQMMEDADKVKSIHGQIDTYSTQYMQNYKAFKSAIGNLEIDAGNTFLPAGTDFIENTLRPWIKEIREFTKEHPNFVSNVAKGIAVIGGLKIGMGVFKLVLGTLTTTFGGAISGAGTLLGWLSKLGVKSKGLYDGFKYFRKGGGKFFESLWKGTQFAYPWLRKIGKVGGAVFKGIGKAAKIGGKIGKYFGGGAMKVIGWFAKMGKATGLFTAKWLVHAARFAVGWLIALGPPGWIILGVTALIIAGVAAWKTNFMGFRDKCISVWNTIKDWSSRTWKSVSGFVSKAIDKISNFIDRVKEALGLASKLDGKQQTWGAIRGVELKGPDVPYLNPNSGNHSQTFQQTNNLTLPSMDLAAEYTKKVTPEQYRNDNPNFNLAANGSYF